MKTFRRFSAVPAFVIVCLLGTAAAGLAGDRKKITVYADRDGDGHYNKKKIEVPSHRYSSSHDHHRVSPYYSRSYPYSYGYGPSFGVTISRSYSQPRYYSENYSDSLAVDVQRELRRRGYYRGAIDGDVGPGTRSAIYEYQADRGLPRTGRIDRTLLRALGIG